MTGLRAFVREHGLCVTLVHHLKKTSTRAVVSAMGSSEYAITRERDAPIVRRQTAAHTVHLRIASQPESARIQVTSPTGCDGRDGGVNSRRGRRRAGRTHQRHRGDHGDTTIEKLEPQVYEEEARSGLGPDSINRSRLLELRMELARKTELLQKLDK